MENKSLEEAGLIRRISAGIREGEVCQILNLKKPGLQRCFNPVRGALFAHGVGFGGSQFQGEPALNLDFGQSQKLWAEILTGLELEGIQVNLGVRTGAPSRLLVLEIHREESLSPFNQRGEWCSGCVAEVELEREQQY